LNAYMARRYDWTGADVVNNSYPWAAGQCGGSAVNMYATYNFCGTPPLTTDRTLVVGFAFKPNSASTNWLVRMCSDNTVGVSLEYYVSGSTRELRVYRGGTLLGTTSTGNAFQINRWHWIELKVYCDDTAGTIEVRYGGRTIYTFTGDTQADASINYHNTLYFTRGSTIDNLYVCDSTGSRNNDFLGPVKITTITPNAAGDAAQWAGSGGGEHHTYVDDFPIANDDSDYVESAVAGEKELWHYTDATDIGETIDAVQVVTLARATDAQCSDLKTLAKSGGGYESEDSGQTVGVDYSEVARIMEAQPGGSDAWTAAALNSYQFGVKVG
jgi:hypothetical protein